MEPNEKKKDKAKGEKPSEKQTKDFAQFADAWEEVLSCGLNEVERVLSEWKHILANKPSINQSLIKLNLALYSRMNSSSFFSEISSPSIRALIENDVEFYLNNPKELKKLSARR